MSKASDVRSISFIDALRKKRNVMTAVILRDMRTRFFNHGLGFLIVALWPLAHMIMLLMIYTLSGRPAPFGDNIRIFFATGLIPSLAFMYISRFMSLSLILNRPMMAFPSVTVVDIMFARAFLEITAAFMTLVFFLIILFALGDDPVPYDIEQAVYAYLATLLLAVGVGTLAGVLVMFFHFFVTIYALAMILVYILSGVLFLASSMPAPIAYALSWNPVLQCVEWMRTAYYPTYSDKLLDKTYVIGYGLTALCLGLLLERVLRWKMLEG
ncbi:capsular biosynthesis protein [Rhizobium sp.]|uniref:ABC transporter permease n=1 Tax=Rhizobium sp. TaxID=391 RepID=UPI002AA6708F